jgi:monoamine oxidase
MPEDYLWQPTTFQPVGGMDKIVEGFVRKVGKLISYRTAITRVELVADGVRVFGTQNGSAFEAHADYCLSSIPFPVLQDVVKQSNFSDSFASAIRATRFEPTCKVGWQANARFWESDKYQIYGGISRTDHNITQMWYPSNDYFTDNGTLTGAYNYDEDAIALGNLSPEKRLVLAREGATLLHSEFKDESIVPSALGLSIAWHRVPYQLGGWSAWSNTPADRLTYGRLLSPDGRFHIIGDQISPLPGWQEGAMISAEYVIRQVAGLESATVPTVRRAPDSRSLTRGG